MLATARLGETGAETVMKTYKVTAATGNVSEDSVEVLGEAYGATYLRREDAEAAKAQLDADRADNGYEDVTYAVESVEMDGDVDPTGPGVGAKLPMCLGVRHDGGADMLDGDADDPETAAGERARGNYHHILPLRTWGDVETAAAWQGHGRDALRRALRRAIGVVVAQGGAR